MMRWLASRRVKHFLALPPPPAIVQLHNEAWHGMGAEWHRVAGKQLRGQTSSFSVPGQPVG